MEISHVTIEIMNYYTILLCVLMLYMFFVPGEMTV